MSTSAEIIQILSDLLTNKTPLDSGKLIPGSTDNIVQIVKDDADFFPNVAPIIGDILASPDYYKMDPDGVLITILDVLTNTIDTNQFLNYYPVPFIIKALDSPMAELSMLAVEVIEQCVQAQRSFLDEYPEVLDKLFEKYFTKTEDDNEPQKLRVLGKIEELLALIVKNDHVVREQILLSNRFVTWRSIKIENDLVLVVRMLTFIIFLLPKYFNDVPDDLYTWPLEYFQENDDVLLVAVILELTNSLLNKINLDDNVPPKLIEEFQSIIKLYTLLMASDNYEDFLFQLLIQLISALTDKCYMSPESNTRNLMIAYFKEKEIFNISSMCLDSNEYMDHILIQSVNANFLYLVNPEFANEFFSGDFVDLFLKQKFSIMINLIRSKGFFDLIKPYLSPELIKSAPSLDRAYTLIDVLSTYDHTYKFLLHSLPSIVVGYLINIPSEISDKEIWELRQLSLELLLYSFPPKDLDGWKKELEESYKLMKNGRNIKDIVPKVDIAHETL